MKKLHKSLLYIAYTLVATGCFLYLLFPVANIQGGGVHLSFEDDARLSDPVRSAAAGFTLGARVRVAKCLTKRPYVGPNRQIECNTPDCIAIVTPENNQLSRQGLSGNPEGAHGCKHV